MKRLKAHSAIVTLLVLVWACSEVIDLQTDESGGQVVIFGRVTNGTFGNFVSVSRTAPQGGAPFPILGATVTITGSDGTSQLLIPGDSGIYEFQPGSFLGGSIGESYSLTVQTGDKVYRTEPQLMPQNYGRETMSFELGQIETITSAQGTITQDVASISARTDFDELPEEFYLRWDIEEAYTYLGTWLPLRHYPLSGGSVQCYVINDLNEQRIFLHNGRENRATTIPARVFVDRVIDKSFQTLHYFNLIRSSLSKQTYDYWSRIDLSVNRQGSIFDVPPAGVPGNVLADTPDEEVLGYFEVVSVDTTRLALTRRDVPVFFFDECDFTGPRFPELFTVPRDCRQCLADEGIVEESCLYCGREPGNTNQRPSYF